MYNNNVKVVNGTTYSQETPQEVIDILEDARLHNKRLAFRYGDLKTGRDFLDFYDTIGYIGRSMGEVKVPLLLPRRNSLGGGALLDHCIIAIKDCESGTALWHSPNYRVPYIALKIEKHEKPFALYVEDALFGRYKLRQHGMAAYNKFVFK